MSTLAKFSDFWVSISGKFPDFWVSISGKVPDFWVSISGKFPDFWVLLSSGQNGTPPFVMGRCCPPSSKCLLPSVTVVLITCTVQ